MCKESKPLGEFSPRRERGPDALESRCKPCMRAKARAYRESRDGDPAFHERRREIDRARHVRHKAKRNAGSREIGRKIRLEVLSHYGGACQCCGEGDMAFLELHHTNNDGKSHRRAISHGIGGTVFFAALKRLGFPDTPPLEVLCANCHTMKRFAKYNAGKCWH